MRYTRRPSIFTFLLLILAFAANAQPLSFEKINYRQGLSHQGIRCIFKDRQGFLWIGTDFGLNRYDGISFKKWFHTDNDTNSLPDNIVNSITQDAAGYIWVGTGKGIARMNPYTGRFSLNSYYITILPAISNYDLVIFTDSADRIWIGNQKGIFILGANRKLQKHIPLQLEPEGKRLNNYIYSFLEDRQVIYVSTSYGLYTVHKKDFSTKQYLLPIETGEDLNRNALTRLTMDTNGIVWCGSWFEGIIWFNPATNTLNCRDVLPTKDKSVGAENVIMDVKAVTENGKVFIYATSYNGLLKIDAASVLQANAVQFQQYRPDKNDPESVNHQVLNVLYKDELNNLWIGSGIGLNKVKIVPPLFTTFSYDKLVNDDFAPYNMVPASTPNTYWIHAGTNNVLYNPLNNEFSLHPFQEQKYSLRYLIKAGNEYYMAAKYGLLHFNNRMQLVKVFDTINTPSLHTEHFNKALYDSKGNIWLGSYRKGIVLYEPAKNMFTSYFHNEQQPFNIYGQDIEGFEEDSHGNIWAATATGALMYDYNTRQFRKITFSNIDKDDCNKTECFYETSNGKFYIGTRDGLYLYNYEDHSAQRIILNGQGISNNICKILEDKNQCLWLCTNSGLVWYNPQTKQKKLYTQKDGLKQDDLDNAFYKYSDSAFWIGTENAITIFNPLAVKESEKTPVPVFSSISIDDRSFSLINPKPLTIAWNQSIGVDFLSLNYFNTTQNQYQYFLKGLDDHWINIGNEHTLRFSNLPAGDYTLKIRAANSDGEWNEQPISLSFTATPPFYKTWWFILLSIITVAAGIYFLYRYRLQQAIKLERIRTRIATDLHDDIGATLSSISMYSDAVKKQVKEKLPHLESVLEKMGENSRTMVSSMSDIVWAINPGNDEGEKLVHRMESYARDICAIKNVPLTFIAGDRINHINLTLELKKNIYLVFKESLNNALKYAEAGQIVVSIQLTGNTIQLMIKDDGKGFDMQNVRKGNGLRNMQARSAEIKATCQLITEPGKGTRVEMTCSV